MIEQLAVPARAVGGFVEMSIDTFVKIFRRPFQFREFIQMPLSFRIIEKADHFFQQVLVFVENEIADQFRQKMGVQNEVLLELNLRYRVFNQGTDYRVA